MQGLKQKLNEIIQKNRYITLQEAYNYGGSLGHKQKTVERELNPSRSPNIFTHKNHKGHITGFSWKPQPEKIQVCCASYLLLSFHDQECEKQRMKDNQPAMF